MMSKVCKMRTVICGILLGVVVCGMSVFATCPSMKLKWYLEKDQCHKVVNLYNQSFAGTSDEEEYANLLLSYIEETKFRWKEEELTYKEAVINLNALCEVKHKRVSSEAKEMSTYIELEGYGAVCYESALSYVENSDYISAMKKLSKIDENYLMYADVVKLNNVCKEAVLKETENLTTIDELEKAIQRMDEYFETVQEPAFAVRKGKLEKELAELKDIIRIVKEASEYYDAENYGSAFQVLEEGMEKYPEHPKMKEGYMMYLELFVEKTVKEAQEACDRKDYGEARKIVEKALEVHECDPLRQVLEYVKEEGNVLYRWWNDVKGFFEKFKVVE